MTDYDGEDFDNIEPNYDRGILDVEWLKYREIKNR